MHYNVQDRHSVDWYHMLHQKTPTDAHKATSCFWIQHHHVLELTSRGHQRRWLSVSTPCISSLA